MRLLGLFCSTAHAPLLGQFFFILGTVLAHSFTIFLRVRSPSRSCCGGQFFFMFGAELARIFTMFLWIRFPSRGCSGGQVFPVLLASQHLVCECLVWIGRLPSARRFTSLFRVRGPPSPVRLPESFRVDSPLLSRPVPSLRPLALPLLVCLFCLRHRCRGFGSRRRDTLPWCCHRSNLALTISVYWPTGRTWMARG